MTSTGKTVVGSANASEATEIGGNSVQRPATDAQMTALCVMVQQYAGSNLPPVEFVPRPTATTGSR